jgi:hypothetical protein
MWLYLFIHRAVFPMFEVPTFTGDGKLISISLNKQSRSLQQLGD